MIKIVFTVHTSEIFPLCPKLMVLYVLIMGLHKEFGVGRDEGC